MSENKAPEKKEYWLLKDAAEDYLPHEPTRHTISDFIPVVTSDYANHLEQKCAELELRLADRSEKYKIAMDKGLDVLNEKCKAYEKALKFYADEENIKESRCETRIHNCDKDVDRGQTAREVLERYGK